MASSVTASHPSTALGRHFVLIATAATDAIARQNFPTAACPGHAARRIADYDRMRGDIFRHDTTGSDECVLAECMPANNRRVRTHGDALAYRRRRKFLFALDVRARRQNVGEDAAGPEEHVIGERNASVHRHVVLNLHTVSDLDAWSDEDVLS